MPAVGRLGGPEITLEELVSMMAGGRELAELSHELKGVGS